MNDGDIERITEEISRLAWQQETPSASRLRRLKAQAGDGYRQATQAFELLEVIYDFLSRLNNVLYKAAWIDERVTTLKQSIEELLPDLKDR